MLKSNAEREKEAERMRQSLKKDLGTYEVSILLQAINFTIKLPRTIAMWKQDRG